METTVILLNTGSAQAQAQLNFFDEAGGELVMESQGPDSSLSIGSAQLFTEGSISGFIIFRYIPSGQEAAALQTQNAASYTLSFDNTGGLATGVAVANVSNQPANIQTILRDDTGRDQIAGSAICVSSIG